ncbi:Iron-sulfur assembly protein 1 [Ophidiomyces ophidiicola]|nr:Iron-sulfur assembly protein 1 [Ophidiomyces ophidiicola]KAI1966766.1 Iron-sulfur assembly protein 1 [Ophidiomyces ophidiicola]
MIGATFSRDVSVNSSAVVPRSANANGVNKRTIHPSLPLLLTPSTACVRLHLDDQRILLLLPYLPMMSLSYAVHNPVTSCLRLIFRDTSRRACSQSTRSFSAYRQGYQSTKRELQTASAYTPHTLSEPFPPRNAGTPDTSISKAIPGLEANELPSDSSKASTTDRFTSYSLPEGEAQKSWPTLTPNSTAPATPPPTQGAAKSRKTKLRPRKAAMTLTPAAVDQLRTLLSQPDPKLIRVGVRNRGCSGLSYNLEYVEKPAPFDEVVEQDGIRVLVDSKALFSIIGSEMDWQEDKLASRFVFKNPNISK